MAKAKNIQPRPRTLSDPLAAAIAPPPNESEEERTRRVQAEVDAKRNSERIDELLRQERTEKKKARPEVNVLLLGQSESGKSTTLKREFKFSLCRVAQLRWVLGVHVLLAVALCGLLYVKLLLEIIVSFHCCIYPRSRSQAYEKHCSRAVSIPILSANSVLLTPPIVPTNTSW